mmetsp:Transcript_33097/g.77457  ORF Transcript_33097/g.77457 Transcript_33097/m.77457 type:complete len:221 (+) Transcript_33097:215-877(+)
MGLCWAQAYEAFRKCLEVSVGVNVHLVGNSNTIIQPEFLRLDLKSFISSIGSRLCQLLKVDPIDDQLCIEWIPEIPDDNFAAAIVLRDVSHSPSVIKRMAIDVHHKDLKHEDLLPNKVDFTAKDSCFTTQRLASALYARCVIDSDYHSFRRPELCIHFVPAKGTKLEHPRLSLRRHQHRPPQHFSGEEVTKHSLAFLTADHLSILCDVDPHGVQPGTGMG